MAEYYLGIDVGYSQKKDTTGLCLITLEDDLLKCSCHNSGTAEDRRLEDLKSLIPKGANLAGVAIDGPLASGLQIVDRYRSAEALLSRSKFQRRCKPGSTKSLVGKSLHDHATRLAKLVERLESEGHLSIDTATHRDSIYRSSIVEAFPNAFMAVMLNESEIVQVKPGRARKSDRLWECLVNHNFPSDLIDAIAPQTRLKMPVTSIMNHDQRAAFVCALAALCVTKGKYVAVGDTEDGHIILPPIEVWGRESTSGDCWAEEVLHENIVSVRRNQKGYTNHEKAQVIRNGKH